MNVMQPKTHRRLLWLAGVTCLLTALIVVGLLVRVHQVRVQTQADRQDGLQAVESGDYERGLGLLGSYLNQQPDDVEVLYSFARARREVEQPRREHLGAAATVLERVIRLDPDHDGAARELADLYLVGGRYDQAVEAADRVLERNPDDDTALRVKVMALRQLDRDDAAIATARSAVEANPDELSWQLLLLDLYGEANRPDEALEHARSWHARDEDDAQALLVLASAHYLAGQNDEALGRLEEAAARPASDASFVRELVRRFDALGEHQRATGLIEHAAMDEPTAEIVQLHTRRLWHGGDAAGVLAYLDNHAQHELGDDVELVAIEVQAALLLGERERAAERTGALRTTDAPSAKAWAALLEVIAEPGPMDSLRVIDHASEVLAESPTNPEALLLLGEAYALSDEPYAAISAWSSAAERAPAWAEPLLRASELARAHPHAGTAVAFAREARRRAPEQVEARAAVLLALAERPQVTERETARLLEAVRELQAEHRFEAGTLPLYVALLSDAGQSEQAEAVVREVLENEPTLDERVWLRLAGSTQLIDDALADDVLAKGIAVHGSTPRFALARALHEADRHDDASAVQAFDYLREAAGVDEGDVHWMLARAKYLERRGDANAQVVWSELLDRHAGDLSVQLAAMRAASVQADRALHRRTIDQVEELTQRRGYTWRVAYARWMADHPNPTPTRLVEALQRATTVLDRVPNHVEARLIAAACLHQLDNHDAAMEHLGAAQQRRPHDLDVNAQLASMLLDRGDFPAARRPLEQFATYAALEAGQPWRIALRVDPTEPTRAFDAFVSPDVVMARHYWQAGEATQAHATLERLFESEAEEQATLTLPTLMLSADFFAGVGDWERAEAIVARLSAYDLPAGSSALLLAELHHRHRGPEAATAGYEALTASTPENAFAWRERIGLAVAEGRISDALALIGQAEAAGSDGVAWSAIRAAERALRVVEIEPDLHALGVAIVREAEHRELAQRVLELIATAYIQPSERETLVLRLRSLAGQNPRLLALQTTVIRLLTLTGDQEQALQWARRTMRQFPGEPEPAELATQLLQASEAWDSLIDVAHERKRLEPAWGMEGDVFLAATYVRADRPVEAAAQLRAHVELLQSEPEENFDVLATYLHALVAAGGVDDAAGMMRPWLSASAQWRQAWRWMAGLVVEDDDAAARWLEEVAAFTPADAFNEQLDLVQQWRLLSRRFDRSDYQVKADDRLAALAEHAEAPAEVHFQHGERAESEGDHDQAEQRFRRALEVDADHTRASYRLARLLARENRSLAEALGYARQAAEQRPNAPERLDLHASIAVRAGEHDEAIAVVEHLRARGMNQLHWQLTHAWVLVEAGDMEQARQVFTPIAAQLPAIQPLPDDMDDRLARIQEALPEFADVQLDAVPASQE